ncbi:MAG: transcriptional regulator [Gammaproteobacteria bacterium]|nr:transcriptional regulator [Gammaproteobacteria bacterium]
MSNPGSEQSLGFLLFEVLRLLRRNFGRRVQLTQVQWRALAILSLNEGINQAGLADLLEVRPITLARLIDRMEEAGWVERRRDPGDRRAVRLYLTRQAGPMMDTMKTLNGETLKQALAGLSKATRKQLIDTLNVIKNNLLAAESAGKSNN